MKDFDYRKFLILFFSFFMFSCCSFGSLKNDDRPIRFLSQVKKSIVSVENYLVFKIKNKKSEKTSYQRSIIKGTGSIIKQDEDISYILTVSHMCSLLDIQIPHLLKKQIKKEEEVLYRSQIILNFQNGEKHIAKVLLLNHAYDVCILAVPKVNLPHIEISKTYPKSGIKYFTLGFPRSIGHGLIDKIPFFDGFFVGEISLNGNKVFAFAIPASNGSSGAPILDSNGKLVGMVHSILSNFDHVLFGATINQIKEGMDFLEKNFLNEDKKNVLRQIKKIEKNLKM